LGENHEKAYRFGLHPLRNCFNESAGPGRGNTQMKKRGLHVLLVEDNAADARLLRQMFSKESPDSFVLTHLTRMHDAEALLAKGGVDIVLLDMGLPDGHGIETVRRARAAAPSIPIVVLTGLEDEALAAEAIKEGAQDYLMKGQIENRALPRALRHAIGCHRMQTETDLMRNHQLQLRDEFLSHVSHELRSPLTSIYSFSTIIADGLAGETTPQQNDYLQIILRNVRQLQSMIEDLLEVSQAQAGKLSIELQSVSINDAIAYAVDTVQGVAMEKEIAVSFQASAGLPLGYADAMRVRQIMTILLDNAIKFTPAGGAVTVEARGREKDDRVLLVEVSDTGCGISAEAAEHIFEQLYQVTDPGRAGRKGLGLGLHIAKELVTRQGGEIWVSSQPQKGSRFYFTLPIFSLAALIRPILTQETKLGNSIAIITVEIECRDGSPDVPRRAVDVARTVLQQCLRPDTDILLPKIDPTSEHNLFFVVAYTEERGAEIIGRRMLNQLRRHEELPPKDFTFAISHSLLPATARRAGESMEVFVEHVATGIQGHINDICYQGQIQP
jgi:signal transduction histidine kinase